MIIQCFNQVTFTHTILCKTTQFFIGLTTFIPILLLLIIAVQRFLKVCRPLKQAMSLNVKRTALILTIVVSLLCALQLPTEVGKQTTLSQPVGSKRRRKDNRRITYKLTVMFFVITLVFIFSYLPKVMLLLFEGLYKDFGKKGRTQKDQD
ncbi:gastrin/cholecystokinin type B receptor-like [Mytilus californianus]|uniref:gastrin/cholecystokinin type B receptor-like n=1 Tax=Mytilus californianus TaxID=6549 RepID=UPI00224850AE|nr:gastrin/cholecystokinin type B receptor-like [Mytilus californianus]